MLGPRTYFFEHLNTQGRYAYIAFTLRQAAATFYLHRAASARWAEAARFDELPRPICDETFRRFEPTL